MEALLILNYDVHDDEQLAAYREAASPVLLDDHGAELVTSTGGTLPLEEAPTAGSHSVVLRFPSVEQAARAYRSEAYQALLTERLAATTPRFAAIVPVTVRAR